METVQVTLQGLSPLLMHNHNIDFDEELAAWLAVPENRKMSKAGDDRSPAWRWLGYCYHDGSELVIPSDNIMTMLREGGAKVPTGKGRGTFKSQTQSCLMVNELGWPIQVKNGSTVQWSKFEELATCADFSVHKACASTSGFKLFCKPGRIGQSKHIRVRPRFDHWSASGTITLMDDQISRKTLEVILKQAGAYVGVGDWRPSSKTPGLFGRFSSVIS
mgnify:CR=1 FL=1